MGAGSSVDMATAGLELPDGGPPPPGADAEFDALVEAEMRKRSSGTEPGIAPPPPRGADPALIAMVEAEMVRQRGFAESYAARNRDLLIATAPWTTRASARPSSARRTGGPTTRRARGERPAAAIKAVRPAGRAAGAVRADGRPAPRRQAPPTRPRCASRWPRRRARCGQLGHRRACPTTTRSGAPRARRRPRGTTFRPRARSAAPTRRPEQEPRRLSYAPAQPSPERLAREDYARDLERQMREREARDRAARAEAASPPPRRAPVGAFPGAAAAPAAPAAFSPPMKQAADHALQGRRDARAKHVREGATGVAAAGLRRPAPRRRRRARSRSRGPATRARSRTGAPRPRAEGRARGADAREPRGQGGGRPQAPRGGRRRGRQVGREGGRGPPAPRGGERAKKQAEQQRLDDLYAQQEADAKKRRNRRHEERTTPLRSPAPRSPRQPPSAQLRSPGSPAVVNTQARRRRRVASSTVARGPEGARRARARPGGAGHEDLRRRPGKGGLGLRGARRGGARAVPGRPGGGALARAALPQNAGGALEALAAEDPAGAGPAHARGPAAPRRARRPPTTPSRTYPPRTTGARLARGRVDVRAAARRVARAEAAYNLADTPPASAGALSPDAIADRWQRDHPLPGAKARRGPAARTSRRQNTVEQSLAGESSFHAFIDPADEAITSPAPPETFEDLADRIPDESFDSTLGA